MTSRPVTCAPSREPVGDTAVPAGQVQHRHPGFDAEEVPNQIRLGVAQRTGRISWRVEVEVVVVEQPLGVEDRLGHQAMAGVSGSRASAAAMSASENSGSSSEPDR